MGYSSEIIWHWQSEWHANRKQRKSKTEVQFRFYGQRNAERHDRYVNAYNNRLKQIGL